MREAVDGVDAIVHAAGLVKARSTDEFFAVNVGGTSNLVQAARSSPRATGQPSSASSTSRASRPAVPRPTAGPCPLDQENPVNAYGRSKLAAEKVVLSAKDDLPVVVLRPGAIYGPRDGEILEVFKSIQRGLLPLVAGGDAKGVWIYATDCAEACVRAIDADVPSGQVVLRRRRHAAPSTRSSSSPTPSARSAGAPASARACPCPSSWRVARGVEAFGRVTNRAVMLTREKASMLLHALGLLIRSHAQGSGLGAQGPAEGGNGPRGGLVPGERLAVRWRSRPRSTNLRPLGPCPAGKDRAKIPHVRLGAQESLRHLPRARDPPAEAAGRGDQRARSRDGEALRRRAQGEDGASSSRSSTTARRSTTSCPRRSPSAARPASASSRCATTTCSSSAAWSCTTGRIAEMRTGEGKTLVATLPCYLNALEGKGVHVVTVNDYLAKRDAEWMGKLYGFLGLSVGVVVNSQGEHEKKRAYRSDITYGQNNEFGFDYLRDNMKFSALEYVAARAQLRDRRRGRLDPHRRGAHAAHHQRPGRAVEPQVPADQRGHPAPPQGRALRRRREGPLGHAHRRRRRARAEAHGDRQPLRPGQPRVAPHPEPVPARALALQARRELPGRRRRQGPHHRRVHRPRARRAAAGPTGCTRRSRRRRTCASRKRRARWRRSPSRTSSASTRSSRA